MIPADIHISEYDLRIAVMVLAVIVLAFLAWHNRPGG